MKILIFLLVIIRGVMAFSQTLPGGPQNDFLQNLKNFHDGNSSIKIYLDPLVEDGYYKHILYNQNNQSVMGYRIRIFRDSGTDARDRANSVLSKFLSKFEGVPADLSYAENTDWVIYVGNCRTRSEVLKLYDKVKVDFPYSFIVSQKIEVSYE